MQINVEKFLPASPAAVWPYATEPEKMNLWSEAKVRFLTPGDGPEPWRIGAFRQVTIQSGRRKIRLEEVVQDSKPGELLVYRVVSGAPVRYHRGEMRLIPQANGTLLKWSVSLRFPLPGMGILARALLEKQLKKSLDAMARVVAGKPEQPFDVTRFPDESAQLPALYAAAEAIYEEQRILADELTARNDPKRWFVRVYQLVTECQLAACRSGEFAHPAWVLRLIPRFHHYYLINLRAWEEQRQHHVEHHWASSFLAQEMARKWKGGDVGEVGYGIAKGMQAHIEEDLPRSLAEVYHWYYRDVCDYGRFRADYLMMSGIFREAATKLIALVPNESITLQNRIFERFVPQELKDRLMAKYYYDIARERRKAFERGERLARLMAGGDDGPVTEPSAEKHQAAS